MSRRLSSEWNVEINAVATETSLEPNWNSIIRYGKEIAVECVYNRTILNNDNGTEEGKKKNSFCTRSVPQNNSRIFSSFFFFGKWTDNMSYCLSSKLKNFQLIKCHIWSRCDFQKRRKKRQKWILNEIVSLDWCSSFGNMARIHFWGFKVSLSFELTSANYSTLWRISKHIFADDKIRSSPIHKRMKDTFYSCEWKIHLNNFVRKSTAKWMNMIKSTVFGIGFFFSEKTTIKIWNRMK